MHQSAPHHGRRVSDLRATRHLAPCCFKPSARAPPGSLARPPIAPLAPCLSLARPRECRRRACCCQCYCQRCCPSDSPRPATQTLPSTSTSASPRSWNSRPCTSAAMVEEGQDRRCRGQHVRARLGPRKLVLRVRYAPLMLLHPFFAAGKHHGGRKSERRRAALFRPEEEEEGPRARIRKKAGGFVKNL